MYNSVSDEDDDSSDADTHSTPADNNLAEEFKDLYDINPTYFAWDDLDDLEMSSRSADDVDEVFPDDVPSPIHSHGRMPNVVLLSYKAFMDSDDNSDDESLSDEGDEVTEESELEDFVTQENAGRPERGFYDVSMFNVLYALSEQGLPDDEDSEQSQRLNYYLHPDIKLEIMMAQQRKHRRIAQLLQLSQHDCQVSPPTVTVSRPDTQKLCPLVIPNTPSHTKLRADSSWIKETPPSPQTEIGPPILSDVEHENVLVQTNNDKTITTDSETVEQCEDSREDVVSPGGEPSNGSEACAGGEPSTGMDTSTGGEIVSEDDLSEGLEHYKKEEIPWAPGRVKRHKQDLEESIKTGLVVRDNTHKMSTSSTSSGAGSLEDDSNDMLTDDLDDSEVGQVQVPIMPDIRITKPSITESPVTVFMPNKVEDCEQSKDKESGEDKSPCSCKEEARPTSIYESEDITLEPGLVKRSKEEIEERQR